MVAEEGVEETAGEVVVVIEEGEVDEEVEHLHLGEATASSVERRWGSFETFSHCFGLFIFWNIFLQND